MTTIEYRVFDMLKVTGETYRVWLERGNVYMADTTYRLWKIIAHRCYVRYYKEY